MSIRRCRCTGAAALLVAAAALLAVTPGVAGAQATKPAALVAGTALPKGKQTTLGLYVTAAQAYQMWKDAPDKVKVIDVRTPEEFAFVGHPEMAWNIPVSFVTYEKKGGKFEYGPKANPDFVAQVKELAKPTDVLLVTCRSGGRGAWRSTSSRRPDSRTRTTSSMGWKATWCRIRRASSTARG